MANSERPPPGERGEAEQEVKAVARAGPAGVLLVTMIILAVVAIIIFGMLVLGSAD